MDYRALFNILFFAAFACGTVTFIASEYFRTKWWRIQPTEVVRRYRRKWYVSIGVFVGFWLLGAVSALLGNFLGYWP